MIQRMVKIDAKVQVEERGREMVYGTIELHSKGDVSETMWKMLDWVE